LCSVMAGTLDLWIGRRARPFRETLDLAGLEPELDDRPEVSALRRVHRLRVPRSALGLRHEAHQIAVAERARVLAERGPGVLERVAVPAELREQFAPQRHEVVPGHRAVWALLLQRETAIHPGEHLVPLAARLEHGGDREAVLGRELRLFAQRDVGSQIAPPGVDRA